MTKETKYAIINFQENDENLIEVIANYLDENAGHVYDFFEVEKVEKAVIDIIPTKKELDSFIRTSRNLPNDSEVPSWLIGTCNKGVITYLSLNDYQNTSHTFSPDKYQEKLEYYKKTILHEYVHFVNELFNKQNDNSPTIKCFLEGIATYLSGQKEGCNIKFDFTLEQLLAKKRFSSCYDGWFLVTKFLIENYDKQFIFELFQSSRMANEFLENELYQKAKDFYCKDKIEKINQ